MRINLKKGFTLAEVLIAVAIVGIVALLVVPPVVNKVQTSMFDSGFKKSTTSILDELNQLSPAERSTITDEAFMKKYLKISKICSYRAACFGNKYTKVEGKNKISGRLELEDKGTCAVLKNGMSLCLKFPPEESRVGDYSVLGYVDLNGKGGPNVVGRDLREFELSIGGKVSSTFKFKIHLPDEDPCKNVIPTASDKSCCSYGENSTTYEVCNPCYGVVPTESDKSCCSYGDNATTVAICSSKPKPVPPLVNPCEGVTPTEEDRSCCDYGDNAKTYEVCNTCYGIVPELSQYGNVSGASCCSFYKKTHPDELNYYCDCYLSGPKDYTSKCCDHPVIKERFAEKCEPPIEKKDINVYTRYVVLSTTGYAPAWKRYKVGVTAVINCGIKYSEPLEYPEEAPTVYLINSNLIGWNLSVKDCKGPEDSDGYTYCGTVLRGQPRSGHQNANDIWNVYNGKELYDPGYARTFHGSQASNTSSKTFVEFLDYWGSEIPTHTGRTTYMLGTLNTNKNGKYSTKHYNHNLQGAYFIEINKYAVVNQKTNVPSFDLSDEAIKDYCSPDSFKGKTHIPLYRTEWEPKNPNYFLRPYDTN